MFLNTNMNDLNNRLLDLLLEKAVEEMERLDARKGLTAIECDFIKFILFNIDCYWLKF